MKSALIAVVMLHAGAQSGLAQTIAVVQVQSRSAAADGRVTLTLASGTQITIPDSDIDGRLTADVLDRLSASAGLAPNTIPIRDKCAADWPADPRMRLSCEQQQIKAANDLVRRKMVSAEERVVRQKCTADWPDDLAMRNSCEDTQLKARQQFVR
jgi:hypothetical protein